MFLYLNSSELNGQKSVNYIQDTFVFIILMDYGDLMITKKLFYI